MSGHASANRFGEHALALEQRRHGRDDRAADRLPLALVVHEEERPVLPHGSAQDATELVAAKLGLDRIGGGKEIPRVQRFVPKELERGASKCIGPRLCRQVDHATVEAAELRGRTIALDLELLNRVDVWKERHLPGLRLQHRNPVEEVFVGARPAAVDARQRRRGRRRHRHARHEAREGDEAPAVEREIDDPAVIDDMAKTRGLAKHRRIRRHGDRFRNAAERELHIQPNGFAGRELDAFASQRPEPAQFDPNLIDARGKAGHHIHTVRATRHRP